MHLYWMFKVHLVVIKHVCILSTQVGAQTQLTDVRTTPANSSLEAAAGYDHGGVGSGSCSSLPARSVQAGEELAEALLCITELTSARQQSALGVKPSYITVISIIPGRLACSSHYLQNDLAQAM